jgi:hypothetical protein
MVRATRDNAKEHIQVDWDVFVRDSASDWVLRRKETRIPKTKAGSIQWQQAQDSPTTEITIPNREIGTVIATLADWLQYAMTNGLDGEV